MIPLLLAFAAFHVPVTCDMQVPPPPHQAAAGVYHPDTRTIQLRPSVCAAIDKARQGWANDGIALAVQTLGHELAHSYGIVNEDGAECVGHIFVGWVASSLGINMPTFRAIWELLSGYRLEACLAWDAQGDHW